MLLDIKYERKFSGPRGGELELGYRVSHETRQMLNIFECLLPYAVLDIEDFFSLFSLKNFN